MPPRALVLYRDRDDTIATANCIHNLYAVNLEQKERIVILEQRQSFLWAAIVVLFCIATCGLLVGTVGMRRALALSKELDKLHELAARFEDVDTVTKSLFRDRVASNLQAGRAKRV